MNNGLESAVDNYLKEMEYRTVQTTGNMLESARNVDANRVRCSLVGYLMDKKSLVDEDKIHVGGINKSILSYDRENPFCPFNLGIITKVTKRKRSFGKMITKTRYIISSEKVPKAQTYIKQMELIIKEASAYQQITEKTEQAKIGVGA